MSAPDRLPGIKLKLAKLREVAAPRSFRMVEALSGDAERNTQARSAALEDAVEVADWLLTEVDHLRAALTKIAEINLPFPTSPTGEFDYLTSRDVVEAARAALGYQP